MRTEHIDKSFVRENGFSPVQLSHTVAHCILIFAVAVIAMAIWKADNFSDHHINQIESIKKIFKTQALCHEDGFKAG